MALEILYSNPGLPVVYKLDSDPTEFNGWGGTNAEENSVLYRTDVPSTYLKNGPNATDWLLIGMATVEFAGFTFTADFENPEVDPQAPKVGMPVVLLATPTPTAGSDSVVRTGTAGNNSLGDPLPQIVGVIVKTSEGPGVSPNRVVVQTSGIVTLTTAQWDGVTLDSGGLEQGQIYYLSFGFNDFGHMSTTIPTDPGIPIVPVGTALNPTKLLLMTPVQNFAVSV